MNRQYELDLGPERARRAFRLIQGGLDDRRAVLLAERRRLQLRIAEIDAIVSARRKRPRRPRESRYSP